MALQIQSVAISLRKAVFHFKSKMLLAQVAKDDNDNRCKYFGNSGVKMTVFHEELDEKIIEEQVNHYQYKIPEQLHMAPDGGTRPYHVFR